MKILIYGCGAIGSAFGGLLAQDGHEVTLYGKAWHLKSIKAHGLKISGILGNYRVSKFQLETQLRRLRNRHRKFDLVLLPVKSYDTVRACQELKSLRINAPILLLQNGLGNIEQAHRIFPKSQILAGRVIFGAELTPGKVNITVWGGDVLIGETSTQAITKRIRQLARMFSRAGIRSRPVWNIRQHIWAKVIYNSALNPLASLLNTHYGSLLESDSTRRLMRAIVRECYAVARKLGQKLNPPSSDLYIKWLFDKLIPDTYRHHPSMLSDLKRGKRTEIDALNGAVVKLGRKCGVRTDVNEALLILIKRRESGL